MQEPGYGKSNHFTVLLVVDCVSFVPRIERKSHVDTTSKGYMNVMCNILYL